MFLAVSRTVVGVVLALLSAVAPALPQGAILQGGPHTPGHAPMYLGSGQQGSQTVVQDSGPAGGGGVGLGLSEGLFVARGTGTAPYAGQGTGPLGTNICDYDAPITNATGYHYLCFSANAQGGGLIAYGAGGAAAALPLTININGSAFQFPFTLTGVVGPNSSTVGDVACWNNLNGTLLSDCGPPLASPTTIAALSAVLTQAQCGRSFENSVSGIVLTLPTAPTNGCTFTLTQGVAGSLGIASASANIYPQLYYYDTSSTNVLSLNTTPLSSLTLFNFRDSITLRYDGTNWVTVGGTPSAVSWGGQALYPSGVGLANITHPQGGASCQFHQVAMLDCNWILTADLFAFQSFDQSMVYQVGFTGTPTNGQQQGVTITVQGTPYTTLYTDQPGDTLTTIAAGVTTAIQNNSALQAAFRTVDARIGVVHSGTTVVLDISYNYMTINAVSSAAVTAALVPTAFGTTGVVDAGPGMTFNRVIPGLRTTIAGDLWSNFTFECNNIFCGKWIQQTLASGIYGWGFGGTNLNTIGTSVAIWVASGLSTSKTDGSSAPCVADAGAGNIVACGTILATRGSGASAQMGQMTDSTTFAAWGAGSSPLASTNYALASNGSLTLLNGGTEIDVTINNTIVERITASAITHVQPTTLAGATVTGSLTATGLVTNASLANMANSTFKCRNTAGTGVPEDCTATQAAAILSKSKAISATRDMTAASASVGYTGFGFKPTTCQLRAGISGGLEWSISVTDSTLGTLTFAYLGTSGFLSPSTAQAVRLLDSAGTSGQVATLLSYDADGLTLGWTKVATPTGTADLYLYCQGQ